MRKERGIELCGRHVAGPDDVCAMHDTIKEEECMRCARCDGLMTPYELMDLLDSIEVTCEAFRCLNCGEIVDPVLVENRSNPEHVAAGRSKRRWTGVLAA